MHLGRLEQAHELCDQLRRARPTSPTTYHLVGEAWEKTGDLNQANQWLTRGALLAEHQRAPRAIALLLIARLRVRNALGLPPDDYDNTAVNVLPYRSTEDLPQPKWARPGHPTFDPPSAHLPRRGAGHARPQLPNAP